MAALTAERLRTNQVGIHALPDVVSFRVKASAKIFKGAIVALNGGYAVPGSTATGLVAVGVATETVDNTSGADGALRVKVKPGAFTFDNATSTDALAVANVGADCYIKDDHTVTVTSTGASKAGKLLDINADGQCVVVIGLGIL